MDALLKIPFQPGKLPRQLQALQSAACQVNS
jgi:hypothetical protein